jgi:hypothetical protein
MRVGDNQPENKRMLDEKGRSLDFQVAVGCLRSGVS